MPHPVGERLVETCIFKDMRSIGPLQDRRGCPEGAGVAI